MSEYYNVHLKWMRETEDFDYKSYNRKHTVFFYGGPKLEISSAPGFLRSPEYQSPEELLVASVSSCFLLTLLSIAAKKGIIIDSYLDNATSTLGHINGSVQAVTQITLRPEIVFKKEHKPSKLIMNQLIKTAHERCLIANSITAMLTISPVCI
jgi:organic hydroperoxide reductase OsmC/OhrA